MSSVETFYDDQSVGALFGGQGVFGPGMGQAAYENYAAAREVFNDASQAVGIDFAEVCFGRLTYLQEDSRIVQPAIVTVDLAEYAAWREINEKDADVATGLSLGMFAALGAAGVFNSPAQTVTATHERAKIMYEVSKKHPGQMVGIVGVMRHELDPILHKAGAKFSVIRDRLRHSYVINVRKDQMEQVEEEARTQGARKWAPLNISGLFHDDIHEESVPLFLDAMQPHFLRDPAKTRLMGNDAEYITTGEQALAHLAEQMTHTADWDGVCQRLASEGLQRVIEFGPDSKRGLSLQMKKSFKAEELLFLSSRGNSLQTA